MRYKPTVITIEDVASALDTEITLAADSSERKNLRYNPATRMYTITMRLADSIDKSDMRTRETSNIQEAVDLYNWRIYEND